MHSVPAEQELGDYSARQIAGHPADNNIAL
jgi:hypothetical protein